MSSGEEKEGRSNEKWIFQESFDQYHIRYKLQDRETRKKLPINHFSVCVHAIVSFVVHLLWIVVIRRYVIRNKSRNVDNRKLSKKPHAH